MNNDHKISPATPSKLSSDQIKQLLKQGDIVDPAEAEVQKWLKLDGTEDPQTQRPIFYPYYESFVLNDYSYLVKEESLEVWQEEIWEQFERIALEMSCKLANGFENKLDLELPNAVPSFISENAAEARKRLISSAAISLDDRPVLESFQDLTRSFLRQNLEHILSRWMTQVLELDDILIPFSSLCADYYFIQYLKWRSTEREKSNVSFDSSYTVAMRDIVTTKIEEVLDIVVEKNGETPNYREIRLLLEETKEWDFLQKISNVQEIHLQFIGILTGHNPISFANSLSRKSENTRDPKYYRNLLRKLSDEKLGAGSKERFQPIIDEIKTKLNAFV